jgi:hypothetical protein
MNLRKKNLKKSLKKYLLTTDVVVIIKTQRSVHPFYVATLSVQDVIFIFFLFFSVLRKDVSFCYFSVRRRQPYLASFVSKDDIVLC